MEGIKQQRVLAIHYGENKNDKKISNVYEMLINLDIEEISKKVIPFMEILTDMIHFCTDLFTEYNKLLEQKTTIFGCRITISWRILKIEVKTPRL